MRKNKMVLVEWTDSNVVHGWSPSDCLGDDMAHCQTVGILLAEDETKITLVLGKSDSHSVLERITIPKGCITTIKELRIK